ncbi:MAG: YcxB family protein [Halieaceae bacterium]
MEIQITLDKEDWKSFQGYAEKTLPKNLKSWMSSPWVNMLIWMLITIFFLSVFNQYSSFHWPTVTAMGAFFILLSALFFFNMFKLKKAFEPSDSGTFCGSHIFRFSEQGISSEGDGYRANHAWSIVKKIEREQGMILIFLDTAFAYVFPEPKLEDPDSFYAFVSEQYSNATSQANGTP